MSRIDPHVTAGPLYGRRIKKNRVNDGGGAMACNEYGSLDDKSMALLRGGNVKPLDGIPAGGGQMDDKAKKDKWKAKEVCWVQRK